ncbi:hypothetical protein [Aquimarina sp. AU474]|uniref:hypothetical protein n=1 Tax=Aquimarina sp. AU474 TaxID=2108529 RepID=UPI000D698CDE|nr:hypothetical protein [Aquimarina sp. AU474]
MKKLNELKGKFRNLDREEKSTIRGGGVVCVLTNGTTARYMGGGDLLSITIQCVNDYGDLCGYCFENIGGGGNGEPTPN